jgi:hypothetical protein
MGRREKKSRYTVMETSSLNSKRSRLNIHTTLLVNLQDISKKVLFFAFSHRNIKAKWLYRVTASVNVV